MQSHNFAYGTLLKRKFTRCFISGRRILPPLLYRHIVTSCDRIEGFADFLFSPLLISFDLLLPCFLPHKRKISSSSLTTILPPPIHPTGSCLTIFLFISEIWRLRIKQLHVGHNSGKIIIHFHLTSSPTTLSSILSFFTLAALSQCCCNLFTSISAPNLLNAYRHRWLLTNRQH